ncbi:hypothetical protein ABID96_000628 [Bacillus sp. OAE603]
MQDPFFVLFRSKLKRRRFVNGIKGIALLNKYLFWRKIIIVTLPNNRIDYLFLPIFTKTKIRQNMIFFLSY